MFTMSEHDFAYMSIVWVFYEHKQ